MAVRLVGRLVAGLLWRWKSQEREKSECTRTAVYFFMKRGMFCVVIGVVFAASVVDDIVIVRGRGVT